MTTRSRPTPRPLAASPFKPRPEPVIETYHLDDRVSHDSFGLGRVVGLEASAVSVDFGSQTVRLPSPYANLEKV